MKNSFGFTWYLAGLSMLGYLAMDMYLPAFGAMGEGYLRFSYANSVANIEDALAAMKTALPKLAAVGAK